MAKYIEHLENGPCHSIGVNQSPLVDVCIFLRLSKLFFVHCCLNTYIGERIHGSNTNRKLPSRIQKKNVNPGEVPIYIFPATILNAAMLGNHLSFDF